MIKKVIKTTIFILLILAIFFGPTFIEVITTPKVEPIEIEEVFVPKEYQLNMVMVGDMLIHSPVYKDAYKDGTYDFTGMIERIKPIIQESDIAFYNQETTLGGVELGLSSYPRFNSPYEVGDAMIDAGFNMVSLANNHTIDRGEKAILNSIVYWNKHKNILTAGSYDSFELKEEDRIFEKNGITYTLLAYTNGTNGLPIPKGKEYLVDVYSKEKAKADIERLRNKVDIIIVSMHWGNEYVHNPNEYQIENANYLASLGVDIIVGTHPHVIQPIDIIDDTIVFYSLGNFLSSQIGIERLIGLIGKVVITKTVYEDYTTVEKELGENELFYNHYHSIKRNNFKLIPFTEVDERILPNYANVYEKYKNIVIKYDNSIIVK
jgi:poly-gamma-glutamate capsule biosynthesis protein CapA/YwtB (metallophosphatase superfamily)